MIGYGLIALLALGLAYGFALGDSGIIDTWLPTALIAVVIFLFYRFVLAVEHIAYES